MKCVNGNCIVSLTVGTFEQHVSSCHTVSNDTGALNTSSFDSDTSPSLKRGRLRGNVLQQNQPAQNSRQRTLENASQEHDESNGEELKDVYFVLLLNHLRVNKTWKANKKR